MKTLLTILAVTLFASSLSIAQADRYGRGYQNHKGGSHRYQSQSFSRYRAYQPQSQSQARSLRNGRPVNGYDIGSTGVGMAMDTEGLVYSGGEGSSYPAQSD
jgi:hypothetical protein